MEALASMELTITRVCALPVSLAPIVSRASTNVIRPRVTTAELALQRAVVHTSALVHAVGLEPDASRALTGVRHVLALTAALVIMSTTRGFATVLLVGQETSRAM